MYLGQTKVSKLGLESFLLVAQKLQVEGLAFEGVEKEGTGKNQIISQEEEVGRLQERNDEKKGKEESVWGDRERADVFVKRVDQYLKLPEKEKDQGDTKKELMYFVEISDKCVTNLEVITQSELTEPVNVNTETSEKNYNCVIPEETIKETIAEKTHSPVCSNCIVCGEMVNSRNITRRIKEKHQGKKEEPCSLCGQGLIRKVKRDLHVCRSDPVLNPF